MTRTAILNEQLEVVECTMTEWVQHQATKVNDGPFKTVGYDVIGNHIVSTKFLGLESFGCWFETVCMRDGEHRATLRAETYEEAVEYHRLYTGYALCEQDEQHSQRQYKLMGELHQHVNDMDIADKFTYEMLA